MPHATKSTRKRRSRKAAQRPAKPYPEFPLTPHASGKWQKKIRGKVHYFGRWGRVVNGKLERVENDGWEEALRLYKAQADDLHAGRTPRATVDGLTLADLCNRFLTAKLRKMEAGEMGRRMFQEYKATTARLIATFGKHRLVDDLVAEDFEQFRAELAKQYGPVRLGNEITRVKSVFKYGLDNGLIEQAVRYGSGFQKPGKAVLRKHKASSGPNMLQANEIRQLLKAANVPMRAMILLGINAGFGNTDVADLPQSAVDLKGGCLDFPRPKTGIERRCRLWPETVKALREAIAVRPEPKHEADTDCVFLTTRRQRCVRTTDDSRTDTVTVQFGRLLRKLEINGRRGLGFYSLRHTHRTVADGARDPVACDTIMGHSDNSRASHYRERIDDERLIAVAEHVRAWLWPKPARKAPANRSASTKQQRRKSKAKTSGSHVPNCGASGRLIHRAV